MSEWFICHLKSHAISFLWLGLYFNVLPKEFEKLASLRFHVKSFFSNCFESRLHTWFWFRLSEGARRAMHVIRLGVPLSTSILLTFSFRSHFEMLPAPTWLAKRIPMNSLLLVWLNLHELGFTGGALVLEYLLIY